VIGALGFSGDATAPHLHLHVADGANPLEAEGLPFVIGPYTKLGRYDAIADLGKTRWQPATAEEMGLTITDWPESNIVVRFNEK
jgi:murein DD-endopeptidase